MADINSCANTRSSSALSFDGSRNGSVAVEMRMTVIDSHHHFWWTRRRPHKFPASFGTSLARDFTPEDLMSEMRRAHIDGTILVQSLNSFEETLEYVELAHQYDFIRGVVGWVPMENPAACAKALTQLTPHRKFSGVRHLNNFEPDPNWFQVPGVDESIGLLAGADLVLEAIPNTQAQRESFLKVSERHPGMRLNLNHLGRPPLPENGWEPWASQMTRAAQNPNMSVKLSIGGDIASQWKWNTDEIRRYADHVLELFGPERVMVASNWPVAMLSGCFAKVWSGIEDLLGTLSDKEFDAVMGGTAEKIYRLNGVAVPA
jgi:L-fuconolactonase